MIELTHFYGLKAEPFPQKVAVENLYMLPGLQALVDRVKFAVKNGVVSIITGDVGSGKSTSLRYACSTFHPNEYSIISLVATGGSLIELMRAILLQYGITYRSFQPAVAMKMVRDIILETVGRKEKPLLVVDEAHLLSGEVFAQLHTLAQFDFDSDPLLPIILCGQDKLIDRLSYPTARPLASRVIGRSHLKALQLESMKAYIDHHLSLAGGTRSPFSDEAILAIHQGSGGLLRRANTLARGAMLASAMEKCQVISGEHVRLASTEII
ncbi:MAG: AAA family ATPase [Spirochaetales bacterium]|nr:AAA family ATPase [Spirochaetales bacterium]